MYEKEGKFKIGAEAYFFSPQQLNDGAKGKSYWIYGKWWAQIEVIKKPHLKFR